MMCILYSQQPNCVFGSPLIDDTKNVLDIGTGGSNGGVDVAERNPSLTVRSVDVNLSALTWVMPHLYARGGE